MKPEPPSCCQSIAQENAALGSTPGCLPSSQLEAPPGAWHTWSPASTGRPGSLRHTARRDRLSYDTAQSRGRARTSSAGKQAQGGTFLVTMSTRANGRGGRTGHLDLGSKRNCSSEAAVCLSSPPPRHSLQGSRHVGLLWGQGTNWFTFCQCAYSQPFLSGGQ